MGQRRLNTFTMPMLEQAPPRYRPTQLPDRTMRAISFFRAMCQPSIDHPNRFFPRALLTLVTSFHHYKASRRLFNILLRSTKFENCPSWTTIIRRHSSTSSESSSMEETGLWKRLGFELWSLFPSSQVGTVPVQHPSPTKLYFPLIGIHLGCITTSNLYEASIGYSTFQLLISFQVI